jgi:putative transposase
MCDAWTLSAHTDSGPTPTPEQEAILARTFRCARFAYNDMLRLRTDAWHNRQERVGYHETSTALMALKKTPEHARLNEVSSVSVQQALRHPQTAFTNLFAKRAKYPNFRFEDGAQSAEYTTSTFEWDGESLKLAKLHAPLAIRWSRTIPKGAKVTTVAVSKDVSGRCRVSMLCDDVVCAKPEISGKVGIGLRSTHFAILSKRGKNTGPKTLRKNVAKLAKL